MGVKISQSWNRVSFCIPSNAGTKHYVKLVSVWNAGRKYTLAFFRLCIDLGREDARNNNKWYRQGSLK